MSEFHGGIWQTIRPPLTSSLNDGAVSAPENYRPVSLTSVPCKLLEHIICSHIRRHLDKFGALVPNNHGFRKSLSCDTQLVLTLQDSFMRRDPPRSRIDVAVLDFAKAFDKVPHRRLMKKLRTYGIGGDVENWIQAFLNERTQQVVVHGCKLDSTAVMSGVPQGAVMGPLLFLLYINDLPSVVDPGTNACLSADDCLIYRQIRSIKDHIQLQKDLDALSKWGEAERTGLHQPSKVLCWVWRSGMGSILEERQTSIGENPESSREVGEWSQMLPAS